MKKKDFEKSCSLCEYSQEIFGGEYCICKKKGIMDPSAHCRAFCFDPMKIKVSVRKIPKFTPLSDLMGISDTKKEEAK